jgi:uncharacterized membrane protein YsdA (DUF1294 family)
MNYIWILFIVIIAINLFAFIFVAVDKRKSLKPGAERLPEVYFFLLAACFGSLGIFLGMFVFRHKTRKFYFPLGIGLILAQQALLINYLIKTIIQ